MRFRPQMILTCVLLLAPLIAAAQSARLVLPDFSALTKKASQSVDISLDPSLLGLASGLLSADPNDADVKDLMTGLQGIYVRSYTFDQDGAYSKADIDAVRAQLVAPAWVPLVSTHDLKAQSDVDIFVRRNGQHTEGMAIITSEPRELTIVNIVGSIDLAKLARLQGRLGVPKIDLPKRDMQGTRSQTPP
jgi:hypothetical protein